MEDDNSHAADQHLLDETVLPQPTYQLTPTEIEVKGFINNVGRQNDLKLFSAELGITDIQQESNFPDGLLDQVRTHTYIHMHFTLQLHYYTDTIPKARVRMKFL